MSNTTQKEETPLSPPAASASASKAKEFRNSRRPRRQKRPFTSGHASKSVITPEESKRQLVESGLSTAPLLLFHPIFVSLRGLYHICSRLYDNLRVRDRHLVDLTLTDIFYTALQCTITKIMRCDSVAGRVDPDLLHMELIFKNILLPSVIADYIDSLGMVTLSNGLCVYPSLQFIAWEDTALKFHNLYVRRHFVHPCLCCEDQAAMPVGYNQAVGLDLIPLKHHGACSVARWHVMPVAVEHYRRYIPRLTKSVDMRAPSPTCEGQLNLIVSRKSMQQDLVAGMAPQVVSDEVAAVGAVYGWNHVDRRSEWPGDAALMSPWTTGVPFSLSHAVATMVQTKMRLFPTY